MVEYPCNCYFHLDLLLNLLPYQTVLMHHLLIWQNLYYENQMIQRNQLSDRIYLLGGRPGTIAEEIVIREPKPRRRDFNLTEDFLSYKRQILNFLK